MTRSPSTSISPWWLSTLLVIAAGLYAANASTAQTTAAAKRTEWEYRSVNVPLFSLQAEMTKLGQDGWEVITILHTDQSVTNTNDGTAHLIAGNVEVIAKRAVEK